MTGDTAVKLGGNITTTNGANNDVTITGPAILTANVDIDVTANSSNTDEGDITFTSSINNVNGSGPFNLTLDGDGGAIAVQGVIGANDAVGVIDINQSTGDGSITLAGIGNGTTTAGNTGTVDIGNSATATLNLGGGSYFTNGATTYEAASGENINLTAATTFKTSDDALTFSTAAVDMADSANLTITTGSGAVTMTDIHGHSNETVSITSTGAVGLQEIGNADEVGVVGVAGSVITLNGDITTDADGNVTLTGPVELATGNITIDTSSASSGDGGNVSLTSTLNSKSGQTRGLTITTKAGTVSIGGVVGDTVAVGALSINTNGTDTGTITLNGIGDGTPALGSGAATIGNTATTGMTLNGDFYDTGAATYSTDGTAIVVNKGSDGTTEFGPTDSAIQFVGGNIDVANGTNLSISSGSGAITVAGIRGTSSETVALTSTGGITVGTGGIGNGNEINNVTITGNATLAGNITTDNNDGDVSITGTVALTQNATIDTSAGDGDISLGSTVDGAKTLTLSSGAGAITVTGDIGAGTALTALTINAQDSETSSGKITINDIGDADAGGVGTGVTKIGNTSTTEIEFTGALYRTDTAATYTTKSAATDGNGNFDVTAAATFQTSADALTFGTGTVELADGANLTITTAGGATSIGAIRGTSAEDVTINVGASTLSVGAVGNAAEIGDIAYTATTVTLTGDQITSADQGGGSGSDTGTFSITGATVISGDVTVDTDVTTGSGTNEDGTLAFSSTIVGAGGTDNLTINSGSGAITLSGTIGVSAPLDALSINASGGAAALSIPQIGTGTAVGNAGTNGAVAIGNSASQSVTLSAAGYKFGGGATTITSGGHVITAANAKIFTDGNITLDPANASQLKTTGAFAITATTADDTINIAGDILGVDDTSNETITLLAGAT